MKVPADCVGEQTKEEKKKLKEERQKAAHTVTSTNGAAAGSHSDLPKLGRSDTVNSMNTLSSGYSATAHRSVTGTMSPTAEEAPVEKKASASTPGSRRNRIIAPPPAQYVKPDEDAGAQTPKGTEVRGRMLFAYQENGEGEITVAEGSDVVILEPDDGSGWIKVRAGSREGLVPTSYVEVLPATPPTTASTFSSNRPDSTYSASSASTSNFTAGAAAAAGKKKGPAVAPKRGAKKLKYVEALYGYTAQSDAEHSMAEGDRFVLINMDAGDGWADVEREGVVKSVPANYIQQV